MLLPAIPHHPAPSSRMRRAAHPWPGAPHGACAGHLSWGRRCSPAVTAPAAALGPAAAGGAATGCSACCCSAGCAAAACCCRSTAGTAAGTGTGACSAAPSQAHSTAASGCQAGCSLPGRLLAAFRAASSARLRTVSALGKPRGWRWPCGMSGRWEGLQLQPAQRSTAQHDAARRSTTQHNAAPYQTWPGLRCAGQNMGPGLQCSGHSLANSVASGQSMPQLPLRNRHCMARAALR